MAEAFLTLHLNEQQTSALGDALSLQDETIEDKLL